ncbi:hypothetical protein BVC80_8873g3 [Macleaya cordata]|uniref:Transmembrane protein n=1 Tax=Macleaya cordata TaxID=56857 RepID=A0A200Q359_MACCD|nr:hypothetical protein BVC80_8873g3 [Macleaya cordata]
MEGNILSCSLICSKSSSPFFHKNPFNVRISLQPTRYYRQSLRIRAGPSSTSSNSSSNDGDNTPPPPPSITPPDTVEIRFRRGSRKRSRQQKQDAGGLPTPSPPKDWESMTLTEKAIELYMGEKGLLFWLNKFAYASIFIIIGAWILFRFVGPSLGFYQLDSPTLSPTNMLK